MAFSELMYENTSYYLQAYNYIVFNLKPLHLLFSYFIT